MWDRRVQPAIVYHAFTDYLRDYEVLVHAVAGQRTGIPPAHLRYLFRYCVEATVETAVSADTWRRCWTTASPSTTPARTWTATCGA